MVFLLRLKTFYNSLNVSVIQKNQEEQCFVAVIRHSWAAQCFVYVLEALPLRITRQTQEMIKNYLIGWKWLEIFLLIIINTYANICCMLEPNEIVCLYVDVVIYFIL